MNDAQLHLLVNHFPILGSLFAVIVLLVGLIGKNKSVINVGLLTLFIAALFAIVASRTGERAEEIVEEMPGMSHDLIHEHEEAAETATYVILGIGVLALITFFLSRSGQKYAKVLQIVTLIGGMATFGLMAYTGHQGGKISHPEIRSEASTTSDEVHQEQDDD